MNKNNVNYQDEEEKIMGKRKIYKSNSMIEIIDNKIKKNTKYIVFNEDRGSNIPICIASCFECSS